MTNMKRCCRCNQDKSILDFHKSKSSKDGLRSYCAQCKKEENKIYKQNNPEKVKLINRAYVAKNREKIRALYYKGSNKWKKANPEKARKMAAKANSKWKKKNPGKWAAIAAKYRAAKMQRTPRWLTKAHLAEIEEFYILAHELSWLSESPLVVDHIIPLQGKNVSGLHVPWNLQILPKNVNCSKGNKVL